MSTVNQSKPMSGPNVFLRSEGLVMFIGGIIVFANQGGNALVFLALLLAPDVAMLGYFVNQTVGAMAYNIAHTFALPAVLLLIGVATVNPVLIQLAAIWLAHIGMDRTVGYGLKYATSFKDSHMQRV